MSSRVGRLTASASRGYRPPATGHFHVFVGDYTSQGLAGGPAWPERRSETPRYYYSPFDHELSPTWSHDGRELIYVGNPENQLRHRCALAARP